MAIDFVLHRAAHREAVAAFNRRLLSALDAAPFLLPLETEPREGLIEIRHYLALDGEEVRGGYLLASYPCVLNGVAATVANIQSPLAESIIDKRFLLLPALMVKQFLRHNPLCFCVGMGQPTNPLPRLLRAAGWSVEAVPFYFRVHRVGRFLRLLPLLRRPAWKRLGAGAIAVTGLGRLLGAVAQRRKCAAPSGFDVIREDGWGDWADEIWTAFKNQCRFAVRRDAAMLRELYPPAEPRLRILRIVAGRRTVGWAAALLTPMRRHPHFGDLYVATILDCAAKPDAFPAVAILVDEALGREGADLVITNQALGRWTAAFGMAGFRSYPSNYQFACSPGLAMQLSNRPVSTELVHLTRGDGDGRIHL